MPNDNALINWAHLVRFASNLKDKFDDVQETLADSIRTANGIANGAISPKQISKTVNIAQGKMLKGKYSPDYNSTTKFPNYRDSTTYSISSEIYVKNYNGKITVSLPSTMASSGYQAFYLLDGDKKVIRSTSANGIRIGATSWIRYDATSETYSINMTEIKSADGTKNGEYIVVTFPYDYSSCYVTTDEENVEFSWLKVSKNNLDTTVTQSLEKADKAAELLDSTIAELSDGHMTNGKYSTSWDTNTKTINYTASSDYSISSPLYIRSYDKVTVSLPDSIPNTGLMGLFLLDSNQKVITSSSPNGIRTGAISWATYNSENKTYTIEIKDIINSGNNAVTDGSYIVVTFPLEHSDCFVKAFVSGGNFDWLTVNFGNLNPKLYFPEMLLGRKYYGVVGKELNFYFAQLYATADWKASNVYPITYYDGTGLNTYDNRISIIPTGAGSHTLGFVSNTVHDNRRITGERNNVTVVVTSKTDFNAARTALFIGDSRTDGQRLTKYAKDTIGSKLTLLGTRGSSPYNHEGRSGWKAEDYVTKASVSGSTNPFWNPTSNKFDFAYYMSSNDYDGVDFVNILLGANDMYSDYSVTCIETMVTSIHAYDENIKVTVMSDYTLPFSAYYTNGYSRCFLSMLYFAKMKAKFDNRETEEVYFLPVNTAISNEYDFDYSEIQESQLNPTTIRVMSDNLHTNTYGSRKVSNAWIMTVLNIE